MKDESSQLVVYYSNYGLEQSSLIQKAGSRSHSSRIRAMALLADSVKIPLSHVLRMSKKQFSTFLDSNEELFAHGLLRIDMTREYADPESYAYDFQRRRFGGRKDALKRVKAFRNRDLKVSTAPATGHGQSALYRQLMSGALERGFLDSYHNARKIKRLISAVEVVSSKEEFDHLLQGFFVDASVMKQAIELSNTAYFTVGALTDQHIITANSFITSDKATAMKELAEEFEVVSNAMNAAKGNAPLSAPLTGVLFDPDTFLLFLKTIGAIQNINDLAYLSDADLVTIREDLGFRKFLNFYRRLASSSASLADLLLQHDVEARRKYKGITLTAGVLIAAFMSATNSDFHVPDGSLHDLFEMIVLMIELLGYFDVEITVGRVLQLGDEIEKSERIMDSILRMAGASIAPLSYAASLVGKTVKKYEPSARCVGP